MSRQTNKERTRGRLIAAVLKVLHKYGPQSLTTGRVTAHAGVAQPTFYVHFKDMDAALEETARFVSDRLRLTPQSRTRDASPRQALQELCRDLTAPLLRQPRLAETFLCFRHDATTPLGRHFARLTSELRQTTASRLSEVNPKLTPEERDLRAELLVGMLLTVVEAKVGGRQDDVDEALKLVVRTALAGIVVHGIADAA